MHNINLNDVDSHMPATDGNRAGSRGRKHKQVHHCRSAPALEGAAPSAAMLDIVHRISQPHRCSPEKAGRPGHRRACARTIVLAVSVVHRGTFQPRVNILGVALCKKGSTVAALHARVQAIVGVCFQHHRQLCCGRTQMLDRIRSIYDAAGAALLFGSGGWTLSAEVWRGCMALEGKWLRAVIPYVGAKGALGTLGVRRPPASRAF